MAIAIALLVALLAGAIGGALLMRRAQPRAPIGRPVAGESGEPDATLILGAFEAVFGGLELGVLAFDAGLSVCFANAEATTLLEAPRGGLAGRSAAEVLRDHEAHLALTQTVRTGEPAQVSLRSAGGRLQLRASLSAVSGPAPWRALALLSDTTEARRMESVRRDFISNVSHELRTPLASIKAAAEVLLEGALSEAEIALQFVESINAETDRMIHLVEELMELTRIESGQVPFKLQPVQPRPVLEEAATRMTAQAERKRIALRVVVEPDLPDISADFDRLVRALLNLVQNSIKFTDEGGTITLSAQRSEDRVCLAVRDTGIGIAVEDVRRVFERFYKVDRARGSSGTGLGLAIVKHTVEAHSGSVQASSTLGQGSTFSILLPGAVTR